MSITAASKASLEALKPVSAVTLPLSMVVGSVAVNDGVAVAARCSDPVMMSLPSTPTRMAPMVCTCSRAMAKTALSSAYSQLSPMPVTIN